VLAAKAGAVGAVAFATGLPTAAGAFAATQRILSARHIDVAASAPGVPRGLLAAGLFLCLMALVGLGVGGMVRNSAGTVAVLFGLVFVVPLVARALPSPWDTRIEPYLISELGQQMSALRPGSLSPGVAALVCLAYAATALGLAGVLIVRRDA
jgi:ABC-2 type transport system permease protein